MCETVNLKLIMPQLKKIIEFNFGMNVYLVDTEYYSENPMLVGDTKVTGKNIEDRFDLSYYSNMFHIYTYGTENETIGNSICFQEKTIDENIKAILLYLAIRYNITKKVLFLDIPENM